MIDNAPFYLDNVPHNGYELNKIFGLKPPMLSDMFDEDVLNINTKNMDKYGNILLFLKAR